MFYEIKKQTGIRALVILLGMLMVIFAGCVVTKTSKPTSADVQDTAEPKIIKEIITGEDPESSMVMIRGNRLLTYTSVKQPYPLGVLLYFPETTLDNIKTDFMLESDIIDSINASELTEEGHTSRIEILLKKDVTYEINREDTGIVISFNKAPETPSVVEQDVGAVEKEEQPIDSGGVSEEKPSEESMVAATQLESVETTQLEKGLKVSVLADGAIKDYKSFTIESPARIVFDMFNIKSPYQKQQVIAVDSKWVKRIRHYGYPDKIRLVLDTDKSYLYGYSALPDPNGLSINVGSVTEVSAYEEKEAGYEPSGPAWVNRIDFSSEDAGKSTVIIGTTRPVKYDIRKTDVDKLQLKLFDTNLPDYRNRPLITTRFESAVDRIAPFHTATMKDTTLVSIELREAVPYFVEQMDNLLLIHFEASSISPKPLEEAALPSWEKVMEQGIASAKEEVSEREEIGTGAPQPDTATKYTGEMIAIDFYDTDIKNVFRILREISGQNFAIDKDVSGKVTLSLEKPVPWDQILDLVLKMNQLGMIQEGNIVRIATRKTIDSEEQVERAKRASEKQVQTEEKALEPLITEYIPVNYAKASADILQHIVVTQGRGSVTVDERNNQIIMTDIAEKIEQAKVTVRRIDKVTPQVIIEARIVEATDSFSREFGTTWTADTAISDGRQLGKIGGDLDLTAAAVNPPASALGLLGISFSRLVGTPLALDATIAASESEGQIKIISAPKIVTLDNTEALIKQGLSYPFNKLDADGNTTTEFKDIALELKVTPHITPDNRISMEIVVKNNEIGAVINNQISFTTKEATTELLVNDGDTVVIGGIRKTTKRDDESGVPGLKDVPILGWLFKTKGKTDDREELLIFITPRIVQLEQRNM